jgi:AmiR/NasT family two-component response regulator
VFIYGIDADEAFDILRRQSQQHNIKVGLIAE